MSENRRFAPGMNVDEHAPTCDIRTTRDGWDADCTCGAWERLKAMNDAPRQTEMLTLLRKARASLYGYYLSAGGDEEARMNGTLKADGRLIDSIDRFIDTWREVAAAPQPSANMTAKVKAAIAALYDDVHQRQTPLTERIAVALDYLESALHQCPATKSVGDEGVAECQRARNHDGPHISGDLGWEDDPPVPPSAAADPPPAPSPAPPREMAQTSIYAAVEHLEKSELLRQLQETEQRLAKVAQLEAEIADDQQRIIAFVREYQALRERERTAFEAGWGYGYRFGSFCYPIDLEPGDVLPPKRASDAWDDYQSQPPKDGSLGR